MGSFNVTCCVTKTPIDCGEVCHLIVFKGLGQKDLIYSETLGMMNIERHLEDVIHGEYSDYGELRTKKGQKKYEFHDNSDPSNSKQFAFYISDEAWKFGKSLITDKDYEDMIEHHKSSYYVIGDKKFDEEKQILICLRLFCSLNNFNMFDVSFQNTYGGQDFEIEEKDRFNKLRMERTDKLRKIMESYE